MVSRLLATTIGMSLVSIGASAFSAETCQTFDRTAPCCPHAAPVCCPAAAAEPVDDATVVAVCGAVTAKGQNYRLDECKRFYERGADLGEVVFGRQSGDAAAFDKLRTDLSSPRGKVTPITVAGARSAFAIRNVSETGALERSAAWALVGTEIIHVEAEVAACSDAQVVTLLGRAIPKLHETNQPTASSTTKRHL